MGRGGCRPRRVEGKSETTTSHCETSVHQRKSPTKRGPVNKVNRLLNKSEDEKVLKIVDIFERLTKPNAKELNI